MNKYKYTRKEYSVAEAAYLAAIIDGEGSIYIGNFSSNPKTGNKYYQTNIEVTNSSIVIIDWLFKTFGGRIYKYTAKQTPKNARRTYYRWIATGDRVTHLCEVILPYILEKKPQTEIMLKMRATYTSDNYVSKGKQGLAPLSKELLEIRQSYFEQIRKLHCRNYNNEKL